MNQPAYILRWNNGPDHEHPGPQVEYFDTEALAMARALAIDPFEVGTVQVRPFLPRDLHEWQARTGST